MPNPVGRPTEGRPINVRLPEDLIKWLDSQGNRPEMIRAAIKWAMTQGDSGWGGSIQCPYCDTTN